MALQRIDGAEGKVDKEITVELPDLQDKRGRWHLIGTGGDPLQPTFYFAEHRPVFADDEIYVWQNGKVIGTAKVTIPGEETRSRYLRSWRHLVSVRYNGDLYLGIAGEKGFAIVRYSPSASSKGK